MTVIQKVILEARPKTEFDIEFTSQQYIHISDEEYIQLLSNVFQHNTGDPLFDQKPPTDLLEVAWKNEKKIKRVDGNSHDEIQIKLLQIAQQKLLVYPNNPVYNNVKK